MARGRTVMGTGGFRVEVSGFREVFDALDKLDRKAARTVTREITKAGRRLADDAGRRVPTDPPVRNWGTYNAAGRNGTSRDLGFNPSAVKSGFKVRRNNFRRRGVSAGLGFDVVQSNAGGSMFEVVGSGRRVTTRSGAALVRTINARFPGRQPRSLLPAYYATTDGLSERIRDMILSEARRVGLR